MRPEPWFVLALVGLAGAARAEPEATAVTVEGERPLRTAAARDRDVSGSVISSERLSQPGATAASVLREAPGVQVTDIGGLGAPATASLRGATSAQTPVYFAGVRVNDEVGGAVNLADLPLFLIDRIEVYRSHAPELTDRPGIGGAIFLEPRVPRSNEVVTGAEAGSHGHRGGHVYTGAVGEEQRVLAGIEFRAADNDYPYFDDRGTLFTSSDDSQARLPNADASLRTAFLVASRNLGPAETALVVHHTDREQGAPKLALLAARQARASYQRDLFALRSRVPVSDGELVLGTQAIAAETVLSDPLLELGRTALETRTPGQRVEQYAEATLSPFDALVVRPRVSVAVDRLQRFERRGGRVEQVLSARRFDARLSGAAELRVFPGWYANAALALNCNDTTTGSLDVCSDNDPDGRVGVSHRHTTYELYASAGRYLRAPTLGERYGVALLVRGDEKLEPERGTSYEFGARLEPWARGAISPLFVDAALFLRQSEQLISYVRTTQGYLTPVNRNRSRTRGAELVVGTAPAVFFEATTQLSLLDARDTSPDRVLENDVLPFASRLVSASRATFRQRIALEALNEAGASLGYLHQSSRYADPAGLGVIPAQSSLDLELFFRSLETLSTRARVSNLLDQRRFDVVGFPLPGRSAFVSVEAMW
jgi:iron complex outermembrane receptor protein